MTTVLADAETYSSVTAPEGYRGGLPSMLSADLPKHTELREPVVVFFQPGAVRPLTPEIRDATESPLDEAAAERDGDRLDVVDGLAWPLPIHTIAALLGVPAEDRAQFKAWSDAVVAGPQMTDGDRRELEAHRQNAALSLANYFAGVCAERRDDPKDDLVSKVLVETDLSDMEELGLFRLLLIAGNVTTTNLITNTLWCLADAGLMDEVRKPGRGSEGMDHLDDAIEEALRYLSPVQRTVRRATGRPNCGVAGVEPDDRLSA